MAAASPGSQSSSLSSSPLQRLSTFKDQSDRSIAQPPSSPASPLSSFSSDPTFSAFLSPDFSCAQFSSQALTTGSAASCAEQLQEAIRLLESNIRSLVVSHRNNLFTHLASLKDADSALSIIRSGVSNLQSSLQHVRMEIAEPHRSINLQTIQLSNIHATFHLLQSTVRLLKQSQKLKELLSQSAADLDRLDVPKAAQLHHEIQMLCDENDLSGISAVDEQMSWLGEIGLQLRSEALKILERGMEGLNQADVGCGLQVFYNLGEMKETVESLVNKYKNQGVKCVTTALDMKTVSASSGGFGRPGGIHRSGTPQIGSGTKAKEGLWQRVGNCMNELHGVIVAVWHLQRVLSKKRDPFTHVLFLDVVIKEDDPILIDRVWEAIVKSFATQLRSAFTASSFVKEIFTTGYPKLFSMVENLFERISLDTDVKGVPPAFSAAVKEQFVGSLNVFQNAFLALCLGRLSDNINNVLPVSSRGSLPSREQISKLNLQIQEEMEVAKLDARLTPLVLHEISKALILLAERAEYQISTGPEARQVTGPATPSQLKNFTLYQYLQEIYTSIWSARSGFPPEIYDVLSAPLGALHGVACDSVASLFQGMLERLEGCILKIHEQSFDVEDLDAAMGNTPSPYMEELKKYLSHFRSEFLSRLMPSSRAFTYAESVCLGLVRGMSTRILFFFIRHAALIRPLSESGKLRMARDLAELELTVGQNLFPVEQLGAPYRALHAFRPIIFLETSQLEGSPLLQDLPLSVVLHHLYSRGPEELQSPWQQNKLTPLQYSLWLDSQGEDQIWRGIKATLDDYAAKMRAKGENEFCSIYFLMLRLGSSMIDNITKQ